MARITIEFDNGDQTVIRLGDQSARLAEYAIGRAVQLQGITLTTALKRQREEEAATIAKLRNPRKLPVPYRETEEADIGTALNERLDLLSAAISSLKFPAIGSVNSVGLVGQVNKALTD